MFACWKKKPISRSHKQVQISMVMTMIHNHAMIRQMKTSRKDFFFFFYIDKIKKMWELISLDIVCRNRVLVMISMEMTAIHNRGWQRLMIISKSKTKGFLFDRIWWICLFMYISMFRDENGFYFLLLYAWIIRFFMINDWIKNL